MTTRHIGISLSLALAIAACAAPPSSPDEDEVASAVALPTTSITVQVLNGANGAPIFGELLVTLGGRGAVFARDLTGAPATVFPVRSGTISFFLDSSASPSPSAPVELSITAAGPGFIKSGWAQQITSTASFTVTLRMVNTAVPPRGISVTRDTTSLRVDSSGRIMAQASIATQPDARTRVSASVTAAAGTVVTDASGVALSGQLSTQLTYFSPRELESLQAFPGGLDVRTIGAPSGSPTALFKSAGMVSVEIQDASGRVGRNFSTPLQISMGIPTGTVDPIANRVVVNGDRIPLWFDETGTGNWTYAGEATAVVQTALVGGDPDISVTFNVDHLTLWNLDYNMPSCGFSRTINLVDGFTGAPIPESTAANFSYRISVADIVTGAFGGYIKSVNANNNSGTPFNVLRFQNAPDIARVLITVFPGPNNTGTALAMRTFNALNEAKLCATGTQSGSLLLALD